MGRKGVKRLHQFVEDLVEICVTELTAGARVDEPAARAIAADIASTLCFRYARTTLYVPAMLELKLSARDEEIWRRYAELSGSTGPYTAARLDEIAADAGVTLRHAYNIVSMVRRKHAAALQPELPGMPDAAA